MNAKRASTKIRSKAATIEKATKSVKPTKAKKTSALEAAVRVLTESKQSLNVGEILQVMTEKGYWSSPAGKTPAATLYSAILREITQKAGAARFTKTARGKFALQR